MRTVSRGRCCNVAAAAGSSLNGRENGNGRTCPRLDTPVTVTGGDSIEAKRGHGHGLMALGLDGVPADLAGQNAPRHHTFSKILGYGGVSTDCDRRWACILWP
eukprot:scaffold45268_cov39-Phaeocystis_antarctica.AAC.1